MGAEGRDRRSLPAASSCPNPPPPPLQLRAAEARAGCPAWRWEAGSILWNQYLLRQEKSFRVCWRTQVLAFRRPLSGDGG